MATCRPMPLEAPTMSATSFCDCAILFQLLQMHYFATVGSQIRAESSKQTRTPLVSKKHLLGPHAITYKLWQLCAENLGSAHGSVAELT
jgi:hypothetical protein